MSRSYETAAWAALPVQELTLLVANPRQVRDSARATGQLAKTDALDAQFLALFAERARPEARSMPDAAAQALAGGRQAGEGGLGRLRAADCPQRDPRHRHPLGRPVGAGAARC